jgi:hypothetical protein
MLDKKPTDGKMRHYVLVMFFDRQRSWYVFFLFHNFMLDVQLIMKF